MYLAPYNLSGHNVCPDATPGCIETCLNTAGRGRFDNVQNARIRRTKMFYDERDDFLSQLIDEIDAHIRKSKRLGLKPAVRLNGTSDIAWEKIKVVGISLLEMFPDVQFYDYTKSFKRATSTLPSNYHLTFSRSENTPDSEIAQVLAMGRNVAVVFGGDIPMSVRVDGDKHDMRFLDPKGVIVGLTAKGKAKKDTSGFVVR